MLHLTRSALIAVLGFAVVAYAWVSYGLLPLGERLHPDMRANFAVHALGIRLHVFASSLALLLGPFQFSRRLRAARPRVHRTLGRVYLGIGVAVGGAAGLYMAMFAFGGWVARLGFAGLAVAWLYTGARAYQAARRRELAAHRRWMIRNFALTLAAVTLRLYLPLSFVLQIPFEQAYPAIAWACWLPNLLLAERLARAADPAAMRAPAQVAPPRP